jgi:hypothetical protein
VREVPIKGQHKGHSRIEVSAGYTKTPAMVWVPSPVVNAVGDRTYHGPRLDEIVAERAEQKAADQAKADKRKPKGRFVRAA